MFTTQYSVYSPNKCVHVFGRIRPGIFYDVIKNAQRPLTISPWPVWTLDYLSLFNIGT